MNFRKTSAVASASLTARWCPSRETPNCSQTMSSLCFFSSGRSERESSNVSRTVFFTSMPHFRSAFRRIKPVSKLALCATSTASWQNSRNLGKISVMTGASATISFVMPVSLVISAGMGRSGFTKVLKRSIILPSTTFTAPISVMLSVSLESPVVSISNTTKVSSRDCPRGMVTTLPKSSIR